MPDDCWGLFEGCGVPVRSHRAGTASSPAESAKLICETRFTGSAGIALTFRYPKRRLCHRNSPGVPPKLFRERCAWHGPDHASNCEERDPKSNQCRRRTSVAGDRIATLLRTGFRTERVTFERPRIIRESRENTASNGSSGREKACGTRDRTRAGSWPASPVPRVRQPRGQEYESARISGVLRSILRARPECHRIVI